MLILQKKKKLTTMNKRNSQTRNASIFKVNLIIESRTKKKKATDMMW